MNNDHINPGHIFKIKGTQELTKKYYGYFEKWEELITILWKGMNLGGFELPPYHDYVRKLIHEGATFAVIAITELGNIEYYTKNPDKIPKRSVDEMTHKMYHNFMMFLIFYESVSIFYENVYKENL
jgi:hypothetical protein